MSRAADLARLLAVAANRGELVAAHELIEAAYGRSAALAAQRRWTSQIISETLGAPPEPGAGTVWALLAAASRAHHRRSAILT